ncbi:pro-sigmaK processing inhibitor BofA family protein [Halalkalibacillus halophilus]|uniref:pro-sigmaK processing inhibitor BofA family protein n=1 Tax=Halalkalibacillus halophilus TaxID=392827 RepID=UPI0003FFE691|nr:pro-sigmaK processing inhibitor BofA family protein [Halalkalibacillus halophilus]
MDPMVIILASVAIIILLLFYGPPIQLLSWTSKGVMKLVIGGVLIFVVNVVGSMFGLHIPINLFTAVIAGFLGIFGIGSLVAIHLFILP